MSRIKIYNKNLTKEQWLAAREQQGIGASEVATVLNMNPYQSAISLYYNKIGRNTKNIRSQKMLMGLKTEPLIASCWKCWVPDADEYLLNLEQGKEVRKLRRVNAFTKSSKFPWLFASFDYEAPKGQLDVFNSFDGQTIPMTFPVQMKNTTFNTTKRWINGLPLYYWLQCQAELIASDNPDAYMEFVYLSDGWEIVNMPIRLSDEITPEMIEAGFEKSFFEEIIERTHSFWHDRVLPARELVKQINELKASGSPDMDLINDLEAQIVSLEPEIDNSEAYEAFLLDEYKTTNDKLIIEGTREDNHWARVYCSANKEIENQKELKQQARNYMISRMRESERINLPNGGRIIWRRSTDKKAYFSCVYNEETKL